MNLLWRLVSCYVGSESGSTGEAGAGRRAREEGRSPARRRKRSKSEWRPSLCSITEDRVVVAERAARAGERKAAAATKSGLGQAGRKSSSRSPARVHARGHSDDYGGVSVTMAIPAFSPTPFMF